jgi:hypothetical protein
MFSVDLKEISRVRFFVADDEYFDEQLQIVPDDLSKRLKEPHIVAWMYFSRLEGRVQLDAKEYVNIKSGPFRWGTKFSNNVDVMELGEAIKRFPNYTVSRLASDPMCPLYTWAAVSHHMGKIYLYRDTWYGDDK